MLNNYISIIYPFRNRDVSRVHLSLKSLQAQTRNNFKVVFVDFGSDFDFAKPAELVVGEFDFATYVYVGHPGLLWNKSKALNYGIKMVATEFIITSDVDVIFSQNFVEIVSKLAETHSFSLFKIGYLSKAVTEQQQKQLNLNSIETTHIGDTFGIGLFPKSLLEKVGGLDEFFHFYGSEDEDLNYRIKAFGAKLNVCNDGLLYHQWHERYPRKKDDQLTHLPRLGNILRINQRQYLLNKEHKVLHPNSKSWGHCYALSDGQRLECPDKIILLENVSSHVTHFFGEAIKTYKGLVIQVIVKEAIYFNSKKYKLKKFFGKQTQPYMSMKAVNDQILEEILFRYRDFNYAYKVSEDLKQISFTIDFKNSYDAAL